MERISDYLSLRQEEAERLLKQAGVSYEIHITSPPRKEQDGFFRVVKQEEDAAGKIHLTVCAIPDVFENA